MIILSDAKYKEIEKKVVKSRIFLLRKYPFYGTLVLSLRIQEDESIPTAGTEGEVIYYNPKFVDSLTPAELNWLLVHEVMHCALGHIWRRGTKQPEKWNVSADYAIHSILMESKSSDFQMPKVGLYNEKFNGKSTEEIYQMLPNPPSMSGNGGQGKGKGEGNDKADGNGNGNGYPQTLDSHDRWNNEKVQKDNQNKAKEWQEKMISAAEMAENKLQGSVPGSIIRLVDKITKPQKNWKQLLAEFVQFEVFDFGFLPPDKRYYGFSDVLMPDFNEETEKVQDIVFIIDTSGSIGDSELIAFYSELIGMMQQFNNSVKGHIMFVDSEVAAVYDFEDVDDIVRAKPAGGGGTDMEEGIKYCINKMNDNEWDVSGCVILTDGYTSYTMSENDIPFKLLWLVTNEEQNPTYGQIARMKIK